MKTIILNGSPRKNWNTAQVLKSAQKGAESVGAERYKCFWKDDLSPVIDRIFAADALFIGSPIYLGDITSQVHAWIYGRRRNPK